MRVACLTWSALYRCWAGLTERRGRLAGLLLLGVLGLAGCAGSSTLAPVGHKPSSRTSQPAGRQGVSTHTVRRGETLYSIAFEYGKDYRQLARQNGIRSPYTIYVGQRLLIQGPPRPPARAVSNSRSAQATSPRRGTEKSPAPSANTPAVQTATAAEKALDWRWPTRGKVIERFSSTDDTRKGIDINGRLGQPITAAAPGRVVYSGSGLRGYGQLIIIKHNERFLSAYAHNRKLLVKEGQQVSQGQAIAEMGSSGADQVKLHFEIRRDGKPIDPLRQLPRQG